MMLILNVLKVSQDWDGANTFTLQIPRFYIFHHLHYDPYKPSTLIMTPIIPMMITLTTVADITICRVRKEDRGRFLCVGKNKVGNATAPALLKVKCE